MGQRFALTGGARGFWPLLLMPLLMQALLLVLLLVLQIMLWFW
jgi:hypothetical protein